MEIKFNVKRKFKVNDKEYNSLEEMPAAIREVYEKAVSKTGGINLEKKSFTKIVFNGQEYESLDSMPADARRMYETIMKEIKSGDAATMEKSGIRIGVDAHGLKDQGISMPVDPASRPIEPKSFFSSRSLLVAAAILALCAILYFIVSANR